MEGDVLIDAVSQHLRLICGKLMAVRSLQLDEHLKGENYRLGFVGQNFIANSLPNFPNDRRRKIT